MILSALHALKSRKWVGALLNILLPFYVIYYIFNSVEDGVAKKILAILTMGASIIAFISGILLIIYTTGL